jgi:hypothetical protein
MRHAHCICLPRGHGVFLQTCGIDHYSSFACVLVRRAAAGAQQAQEVLEHLANQQKGSGGAQPQQAATETKQPGGSPGSTAHAQSQQKGQQHEQQQHAAGAAGGFRTDTSGAGSADPGGSASGSASMGEDANAGSGGPGASSHQASGQSSSWAARGRRAMGVVWQEVTEAISPSPGAAIFALEACSPHFGLQSALKSITDSGSLEPAVCALSGTHDNASRRLNAYACRDNVCDEAAGRCAAPVGRRGRQPLRSPHRRAAREVGSNSWLKATKCCQEQNILHTHLLGCHRTTPASAMTYAWYLLLCSVWRKRWNSFAGRYADHALFRRLSSVGSSAAARSRDAAEDLRERWETSDSPFVHRIQVGVDQGPTLHYYTNTLCHMLTAPAGPQAPSALQ